MVADFNIRFLGAAILPKVGFPSPLTLPHPPHAYFETWHHIVMAYFSLSLAPPSPLYYQFVTAAIIAEFRAKSRCTRETGEKIAARSFDHCAHAFRGFER